MKKITNVINLIIILLIPTIFIIDNTNELIYITKNKFNEKKVNTSLLTLEEEKLINEIKSKKTSENEEVKSTCKNIDEESVRIEIKKDNNFVNEEENIDNKEKNNNVVLVNGNVTNIDIYVGMKINANMAAYGTDCCSSNVQLQGRTASGYNIKTNGIYYNDPTYGKVRILASDTKFKLYSIIKVTDEIEGTYYAIILDRGDKNIGINRLYLFDLVVESQEKARVEYGVHKNVIFEVIRVGK